MTEKASNAGDRLLQTAETLVGVSGGADLEPFVCARADEVYKT